MPGARPEFVSPAARQRGLKQLGTLGSGNHFLEVQSVDAVSFPEFAEALGIARGTVTIMLHCGSRGLGHQVATDYIGVMDQFLARAGTHLVDRQLSCAPIGSEEGQRYLAAMAAGANFAWANRQVITHGIRRAFREVFQQPDEELDLAVVYDISHNMAKVEEHAVADGRKKVLVHRKGATRAFPPAARKCPRPIDRSASRSWSPGTWAPRATCSPAFRPRWIGPSGPLATGPVGGCPGTPRSGNSGSRRSRAACGTKGSSCARPLEKA